MEELNKRLKSPLFVGAMLALLYQFLDEFGYAPDLGSWENIVDVVSYVLIALGIYSKNWQ
jgi:hypothetical protein